MSELLTFVALVGLGVTMGYAGYLLERRDRRLERERLREMTDAEWQHYLDAFAREINKALVPAYRSAAVAMKEAADALQPYVEILRKVNE
jgi:hypothetical protein